jgi:A/G-specific adenine glycosylase
MSSRGPDPELDPAARLLAWWDSGHTDLPWRRESDPYAIWIAEVMLQQTQIATVIPYFERWMARFPTVEQLAQASLDDVLKQWQGLGYYSRARNLHAAAKQIVQDYQGQLPQTVEELLSLPGIGRYTAGAIASIAYDTAVPVVDGNVVRVLSRLFDIEADVTLPATQRQLWATAGGLVPAARAGDYNQALMELGQLVCTPAAPRCARCPLASQCLARRRGTQEERPVRPPRKRTPHYDVVAGVIWQTTPSATSHFLITKRPLQGMLGGLWEFPGGKVESGETHAQALQREIREELAIEIQVNEPLCTVQHAYTHFRISLHAYCARHQTGQPQHIGVADHAWVTLGDLEQYPFAVTDLKIIEKLKQALS